ncbi:FecR family protein [Roseomonas sp. USHLN139]|uniref:FecR family protein n=1 Tax=Roseomonas sp. USHLN139 TaxID=3081298 RepID=UPI003B01B575
MPYPPAMTPAPPRPAEAAPALLRDAASWAARLATGAAPLSPEEQAALRAWCAGDPARARALESLSFIWEDAALAEAARQVAGEAPAPAPPRRRALLAGGGAAALGLAGGLWLGRAPLRRALADAATAPGEIRALPPLPGGGELLLDTASALDLPGPGQAVLRQGALRLALPAGAAPFRLEGRHTAWRLAPGSFLAFFREAAGDRLALLRGAARPEGSGPDLTAGQGLLWGAQGPGPPRRLTLAEQDRVEGFAEAWRLFDSAPLAAVAAELAAYRPGLLLVAGEIAPLRVSGRYRFAEPDRVLALLAQSLPLAVRHFGPVTRLTAA